MFRGGFVRSVGAALLPYFSGKTSIRRTFAATLAGAWLLLLATTCSALDVKEVLWGFDGRVAPRRFNPVSILISNPTPQPFDGTLRLQKQLSAGQSVDAPVEEPLFLSPMSSKWVTLYPYSIQNWEEWSLSWGRGPANRVELPQPKFASAAYVLLDDPATIGRKPGSLKRFPETVFPVSVTGTDSLRTVVLDHVPRWEAVRRQAFLDWLQRGGTLHLIQTSDGKLPVFSGNLDVLNAPGDRFRVGAGLVQRHAIGAHQLTAEFVNAEILHGDADAMRADDSTDATQPSAPSDRPAGTRSDPEETFPYALRQMTRPHHNWPLIYGMSFIYTALVFPGCYLLGRRVRDYRASYLGLLAAVALFSIGFSYVGQRGYGETTMGHSLAIVRPLGTGEYDVTQWSGLFVTEGGYYSVMYEGTGALYSTGQDDESVNGIIQNGAEGRLYVDIPPYSARGVCHRIKIQGPPLKLQVKTWEAEGDRLKQLVLSIDGQFPANPLFVKALHGTSLYHLEHRGGGGTLQLTGSVTPLDQTQNDSDSGVTLGTYGRFGQDDNRPIAERFQTLFAPLVTRSLDVGGRNRPGSFTLPPRQVRVFIYAPQTEAFFNKDPRLGKQAGYVLYSIDVFEPEGT